MYVSYEAVVEAKIDVVIGTWYYDTRYIVYLQVQLL